MIRYIVILICCLSLSAGINAQGFKCGTRAKNGGIRVDSAAAAKRWQQYRTTATYPLLIKLYVVIFSDNDGSNVSAPDSLVMTDLLYMRNYYAPHNICFVLSGIEHVSNSDLNIQHGGTEEEELEPYLKDGYLCIFIHNAVYDDDDNTLGGRAYDIPNTYLSIDGDELDDQRDIIAHEVGHCFGLYHTFEEAYGQENVARNGDCRDCEGDGDMLCDTPADRNVDASFINQTTCEYTGNRTDECGVQLNMAPTNIMSYGRASCRDHFTNTQGARARDFIIDELGDLINLIAADFRDVTNVITYSTGFVSAVGKYSVEFKSPAFVTNGSARLFSSAYIVDVKPGTTFSPGSGGVAELRPNPFCQ